MSAACAARSRSLVLKARTPTTIASKRASAGAPAGQRVVAEQRDVVADAAQAGRDLVARARGRSRSASPPVASVERDQRAPRASTSIRLDRDVRRARCARRRARSARAARSRRRSAASRRRPAPRAPLPPAPGGPGTRSVASLPTRAERERRRRRLDRPARRAPRRAARPVTDGAPAASSTRERAAAPSPGTSARSCRDAPTRRA